MIIHKEMTHEERIQRFCLRVRRCGGWPLTLDKIRNNFNKSLIGSIREADLKSRLIDDLKEEAFAHNYDITPDAMIDMGYNQFQEKDYERFANAIIEGLK